MTADIYHNVRTGQHSFARAAGSPQAWHRLGQEMQADANFDEWVQAAGMDYEVLSAPVQFTSPDGHVRMMGTRRVFFRSDTNEPLAVNSQRYKVVQPAEVAEFFQTVEGLETMGVLRGGAAYWALVRLGGDVSIAGDVHRPYGLISTACDGSLATTVRSVMTRVVCANTLSVATGEKNSELVKVKHSTEFRPAEVRKAIGLLQKHQDLKAMSARLERLADVRVDPLQAKRFFEELLTGAPVVDRKADNLDDLLQGKVRARESGIQVTERKRAIRGFDTLMDSYLIAPGARPGTAYGLVQGVSRFVDHERGSNDDKRLDSALFGQGSRLKAQAIELATERFAA